ncbi:MAG: FAD-dependent monooxygenase [Paracoccaceae bacterium]
MTGLNGRRAHVVGGGIGGLTTALALARQGASVRVFEQAPEFAEVGAGIQITPNAMRALEALGLRDALDERAVLSDTVVPTDGLTGRPLARFDLRGYSPRYRFIHRARLIDLLAEACRAAGVGLTLNTPVKVTTYEGRPVPDLPDYGPAADLVVFADGLRSQGRAALNGAGDPPFTGQVAWRALVQGDHPPEARIHMLPGRHVVTYPLAGGVTNLVAVQERSDWAAEGWSLADDPANLRAAFQDAGQDLCGLLDRVESVNLWGLFRHPVATHWFKGDIALVGDAAHPTLPFLAQGANLAIEDAYVLARCCAEDGVGDGLARYQDLRRPRVSRAIEAANANAGNYHLGGPRRWIAHRGLNALGLIAPGAFLNRLGWLYDHDVTA